MTHRIVRPEPGEFVSVSVDTPFLLAGEEVILSSNYLTVSSGRLPSGALSVLFAFADTDYGKEMSAAVRETINAINERWGLNGDWEPREFEFTGNRTEPFRKREQA